MITSPYFNNVVFFPTSTANTNTSLSASNTSTSSSSSSSSTAAALGSVSASVSAITSSNTPQTNLYQQQLTDFPPVSNHVVATAPGLHDVQFIESLKSKQRLLFQQQATAYWNHYIQQQQQSYVDFWSNSTAVSSPTPQQFFDPFYPFGPIDSRYVLSLY